MTGKAENEISITDYIKNSNRNRSISGAENRARRSPLNVTVPQFGSSPSSSTLGVTTDFLAVAGGSMVGPIALLGRQVLIDSANNIDISTLGVNTQNNESTYTSNISFDLDESATRQLDTINGAAFDGQILVIRGGTPEGDPESLTISQFLNLTIATIDGDGSTTVTVTLPVGTGTGLTIGNKVNISGTTSFDAVGAEILTKPTLDSFTYQLLPSAPIAPEAQGVVLRGNIQTLDGRNIAVTASQPIQSWLLVFDSGISNNTSQGIWRVISGTTADIGKLDNFGTLTANFEIDFNAFREDILTGNILLTPAPGTINITFKNATTAIRLHMRIYLLSENPTLFIGGTEINGPPVDTKPWVVNDFLDVDLRFDSGNTAVIEVVKKNNNIDTGGADVAPNVPGNIFAAGNSSSTIKVMWNQPTIGTLPIVYDLTYSLDSTSIGGDPANGPLNPIAQIEDIVANEQTVSGLASATTYFFWVRGQNAIGTGPYNGAQQTNTDGAAFPGNINFTLGTVTSSSIEWTWQQPAGGGRFFTLIRTNPNGDNVVLLENSTVTSFDDTGLDPETTYPYTILVLNGFNTNIGSIFVPNTQTLPIPAPVLTLSVPGGGRKLQFSVPIIAGINICRVEWSIDNAFPVANTASLQMVKTSAKDVEQVVVETTQDLAQNTKFFVRAQFQLNDIDGQFNATQDETTGTLATPTEPKLGQVSPSTGVMKIEVRFNNSISVGESAIYTWRLNNNALLPYVSIQGNTWSRDIKPIDNVALDENRVTVARRGGGWGALVTVNMTGTTVNSITIIRGGNGYSTGDPVTFIQQLFSGTGDLNDTDVFGTAIASGSGLLTGVNFTDNESNGNIVNGNSVQVLGQNSDPNYDGWAPGNQVGARLVSANAVGTSTPDFETDNVDN